MVNYDSWHELAKVEKSVPCSNNYTYRSAIKLLDRYITNRMNILDVGCGVGTLDFYIAKKAHSVFGIDVSTKSIEIAKKSSGILKINNKISFSQMDFPSETPKDKFDFIICSEVLEHIKNDALALKKITGLLKKQGRLLISVPLSSAPLYKLGILKKFDEKVGHLRRYSTENIIKLIKQNSYSINEVVETEGIFRNFLFTNKIGTIPLKFANKFGLISNIFTVIDNVTGKLFGYSNVYILATKK